MAKMKNKNLDSLLASVTPDQLILNELKSKKTSPWNNDAMEFFESDKFCNAKLYPNQRLLLKIINLQLDDLTDYEKMTLDKWRASFSNEAYTIGINEDIYDRVKQLKDAGYDWFTTIILILGRRASKTFLSGLQLALQDATLMFYGIPSVTMDDDGSISDKDDATFSYVMAKTIGQAKETTFASHYSAVMSCKWLSQYVERATPFEIRFQTFDDKMHSIDLVSQGMPLESPISSFIARPVSSDSDSNRGRACIAPDDYVITSDRKWVKIKDIMPGDRLMAFAEHYPYSKMDAVVLYKWKAVKPCVKLNFTSGNDLTCSIDHVIMMSDYSWREAKDIHAGDSVKTISGVKKVFGVSDAGTREVIDITTSTHTFLANNIRVHNCVALAYDEIFFANVGDSSRSGDRGVRAMQPALQQFGKSKLMLFPSSPWTRTGVVYDKYLQGREHVEDYFTHSGIESNKQNNDALKSDIDKANARLAVDPTIFVAQLESWELYENYQDQSFVPTYYSGFTPKKLKVDDGGKTEDILVDTNAKAGEYIYVED